MTTTPFQNSAILREVARLYIRQQRESVACCEGTSLTECWIVTDLGRSGGRTLSALARSIGFDKSWTSRAVDQLAESGLVTKKVDPADGRRIRIALSAKGRRKYQRVNQTLDEHARLVMARIPASKRRQVIEALALVHEALAAHADEGRKEASHAG